MPNNTETFDQLITMLDHTLHHQQPSPHPNDAITRTLNTAPRTTAVTSLRDAPEIQRFREDLANGFIRLDTANTLFTLINQVLTRMGGPSL